MKRLIVAIVGAVLTTVGAIAVSAQADPSEYAIESASAGTSTTQAGAHADFTVSFVLKNDAHGEVPSTTKDIFFDAPPGLLVDPNAVPKCSAAQLADTDINDPRNEKGCPQASQVGITEVKIEEGKKKAVAPVFEPVYSMEPRFGEPARFGFIADYLPVLIDTELNEAREYGATAKVEGASSLVSIVAAETTFWGVPADKSHDEQRITPFEAIHSEGPQTENGKRAADLIPVPYMLNPTRCGLNQGVNISAISYEFPGLRTEAFAAMAPNTGCGLLDFRPSLSAIPTATEAGTGSGLDVEVKFPTDGYEQPNLLGGALQKKVETILPEGVTVNPSEADGLGSCSEADLSRETATSFSGEGCPNDSKIGTVSAVSPLLDESAEGSLYIAKPYANPVGSLVALYLVLKIPDRGIVVKLAGKVDPDQATGRLVTTFDNIPQLPVSKFDLHFREGARAPLVTPAGCGTYRTVSNFTPWSDPGRLVSTVSSFAITSGVNGGPCPSGGVAPFAPEVHAGTLNNAAAHFSPLNLQIGRNDGEQELTRFSTVLPSGLTGNLTGIPFCPESTIESARKATGSQELNAPSCPAASEIGHTLVGAGVGSVLAWTPGKVYLAGPYHGAALSIVSVTSAVAGPFDLGTVVIRFGLRINPTTAQAEVDATGSDPIPHIIQGIVVHVRDIHVYIDRPNFILNPTSCNRLSITNTITGAGADFTNPADDPAVTVATPFQAADCQNLQFKPIFKAFTAARTSRAKGASLTVKLSYPKAPSGTQANIRSVKVELPRQLPSRLTTLQQACTNAQFEVNPAGCPAASIVGSATAITPILPVPLAGPAYFVSHGGAKFPELIIVLQGYGFTIDLHGETFIDKAGITSSTFRAVPDQPVTSFELTLPQGKYSALAANGNLCKSKLAMPTSFTAQNGMAIHTSTPIQVTGCKRSIGVLRRQVNKNKLTITAEVPSAGRLTAVGHGLTATGERADRAGTVTITLTLSAKERAVLARHPGRRLKTHVKLLFTPAHGHVITGAVTVLMG